MQTIQAYKFTVTRQLRWHDGEHVVEISQGGIDFTNPDALVAKYRGEFETFTGLTAAVEAAIEVAEAWKKEPKLRRKIRIAVGCTHGMTAHFDDEPATKKTYEALRKEAKEYDERLPRCPHCGDILEDERYKPTMFYVEDDEACCSEYCCEMRHLQQDEDESEEE